MESVKIEKMYRKTLAKCLVHTHPAKGSLELSAWVQICLRGQVAVCPLLLCFYYREPGLLRALNQGDKLQWNPALPNVPKTVTIQVCWKAETGG